jgi:hypothetical protein
MRTVLVLPTLIRIFRPDQQIGRSNKIRKVWYSASSCYKKQKVYLVVLVYTDKKGVKKVKVKMELNSEIHIFSSCLLEYIVSVALPEYFSAALGLLNLLENSLGHSKPATRLMQAQLHTVWKFLLYTSLTEQPSIEIKWALQDVSELGYLFLDKSSLHIVACC